MLYYIPQWFKIEWDILSRSSNSNGKFLIWTNSPLICDIHYHNEQKTRSDRDKNKEPTTGSESYIIHK